jgi:hypothetical protein
MSNVETVESATWHLVTMADFPGGVPCSAHEVGASGISISRTRKQTKMTLPMLTELSLRFCLDIDDSTLTSHSTVSRN